MKKKLTAKQRKEIYTERAKFARKSGFNISYRGNRAATPQQKSAVTRAYNRISAYTEKHRFEFKKLKQSQLSKIKGNVPRQQITPSGVFIQLPQGYSRKDIKVSIKSGHIEIDTPNRRDEMVRLNPEELVVDPIATVKEALGRKKPDFIKVVVNGFEAKTNTHSFSEPGDAMLFFGYWEELIRDLTDPEIRQEKYEKARSENSTPGMRRYGGRIMTEDEISDVFQLKLIYAKQIKNTGKKKQK